MRIGMLILGIVMLIIPIMIYKYTSSNSSGGSWIFYGMFITGIIFILYGLAGSRTFKCMNCKKQFNTTDNLQGNIVTCPNCSERYYLKGNKIYDMRKLELLLQIQQQAQIPQANSQMLDRTQPQFQLASSQSQIQSQTQYPQQAYQQQYQQPAYQPQTMPLTISPAVDAIEDARQHSSARICARCGQPIPSEYEVCPRCQSPFG